jgi:ABC-2 type transport system ATP-binding protein
MIASGGDVVLRTVGLTRRFGRTLAVDGLDLEVPRGTVYGFLGPNGSGKTTTIGMVVGLLRPTRGHVELFGLRGAGNLARGLKRTGAVLEGAACYPHLSGRDNLRVWGLISGGVSESRIDQALETVGLRDRARSKAASYSLGMRQRLAIAAALLTDPELIVLDEPTNGLDPAGMREVRSLIKDLGRAGKSVFVSSHLLAEVEQMCDYVGVLKRGRLLTQGQVAELLRRGQTLEMEVTDPEAALSVLRSLNFVRDVERVDSRLIVEAPRERAADISRALAESGVYLFELRPRDSTLEDFFIQVTGEGEQIG